MPMYKIKVWETTEHLVLVEADDAETAIRKAKDGYGQQVLLPQTVKTAEIISERDLPPDQENPYEGLPIT